MNSYMKSVRMTPDDYREFIEHMKGPTGPDKAGMTFEQWLDACFKGFERIRSEDAREVTYSEVPLLDPEVEAEWIVSFTDWNHLSIVAQELGVI